MRLNFSHFTQDWDSEWQQILFTDESRFCLFSNDRRSRVYRTEGERFHRDCVFEFDRFQSKGIMVWAGISYNFKTDLVFVDGSLSSNSYIEQIIRPHIIPFMNLS